MAQDMVTISVEEYRALLTVFYMLDAYEHNATASTAEAWMQAIHKANKIRPVDNIKDEEMDFS
jgi:hypothetical protein